MRNYSNTSYFLLFLATAVGYYVAGRLGLLLAVPPGYATPIWPASGVALAAILFWGYRMWPGVLLGSFFTNISLGVDTSNLSALLPTLLVPFSISCGAALQAVVGGLLCHKFLGPNPRLDLIRDIMKFIILAPVASSMVNATIGTTSLLLGNVVTPDNYLFNWATWWCGDAVGILISTVVLMTFLGSPQDIWRPRRYTIALPLLLAFSGMVGIYFMASSWEVSKQKARFDRNAEQIFEAIEKSVEQHKEVLQAMSGLFMSSEYVSRTEFNQFVAHSLETQPSIQALEWIPRVQHELREEYEREAHELGYSNFEFKEINDDSLIPAAERDLYYPVYYLAPLEGNEKALGLDLWSNKSRKQAIQTAITTSIPTSTESIRLVQESGNQRAIIIFLAVTPPSTSSHPTGLVNAVIRIGDLIGSSMSAEDAEAMVLTLCEFDQNGEPKLVISSADLWPASIAGKEVSGFVWEKTLDIGNREWIIKLAASQTFLVQARSLLPWGMLAGGLMFLGLLGAFLLSITGEAYREKQAATRISNTLGELRETQAQLVESERFASMGGMMSGLAHEINGPIGIAVTALSSLEGRAEECCEKFKRGEMDNETCERFLDFLREATGISLRNLQNAAQLIRSFKEVTVDRSTGDIRRINLKNYLNEILEYMRPMYKRSGHQIQLQCPDSISITTVPGGFSQVIGNLISNSLHHAFNASEKGQIHIHVEERDGGICIQFSDNGIGIPEENQQRIFEPYFTTRKDQGGTGLGLHLVGNIISDQLKGSIKLLPGAGTRFEIHLPKDVTA